MTTEVAVSAKSSAGCFARDLSGGDAITTFVRQWRPIVEEIWSAHRSWCRPSEDSRKIFRDDVMRLSLITIRIFEHLNLLRRRQHSWTRTGAASRSNRIRRVSKTAMVADRFCEVSRRIFPFLQRVFADSGYAGQKVTTATLIAVELVRKNPDQVGFAVNPRRWVVERFFAWIGRNRRLAKDFEATIDSARAFLYAASVMLLVRRMSSFMTFETDSKVNNSLTTDRTVPNMQRLRTISMRQTKDFLQPQKRTPTEKMFKTWATLGQPAECNELSLRWSFMSNIRMVRRSGHSWPRMATSASIVAIFAGFVALLWLFLHLL